MLLGRLGRGDYWEFGVERWLKYQEWEIFSWKFDVEIPLDLDDVAYVVTSFAY
jgi:hypothetical protein